jgi:broad specificity phosphatase PhoE
MRPVDLGATRLFVLRHCRSLANEASIIVSRLDNGLLPQYALAPAGVEQAAAAGTALLAWLTANGVAPTDVCVLASPFSRTVQTAHTAVAQLGLDAARVVRTDEALRERFFGDALELRDHRCVTAARVLVRSRA